MNDGPLGARFDLIEIDGEGILLDRESGGVYRLNRTAYDMWAALAAGQSIGEISGQLCRRFGLDENQAAHDTRAVLHEIPKASVKPISDPFHWGATVNGYGFFEGERLVCEIDGAGTSLLLAGGAIVTEAEARSHLKSVAPKILALRDVFVLHASAVEIDGSLLVFSGRSGAGKTTSARAFARAGARLISEDLLVLVPSPTGPRAAATGEAAIHAWIVEQAALRMCAPEQAITCEPLARSVEGPTLPIAQILLIDAGRRTGARMQLERMPRPDALIALLESAYFASPDARHWRARFDPLRDLVTGAATARVIMPDGLPALDAAVLSFRQRAIIAS